MKRTYIVGAGVATAALSLLVTGPAHATTNNPSPQTLPHSVTYFAKGSSCEPGSIYSACYYTGPDFTGTSIGVPWGQDDVQLNGRWHFRSAKAIDGIAVGYGPTDGTSMAMCARWDSSKGKAVQWADLSTEGSDEPMSVVGHFKATTPSLDGRSAAVDCSHLTHKPDPDGYMRHHDKI